MARHRTGKKILPELMFVQFNNGYMRHDRNVLTDMVQQPCFDAMKNDKPPRGSKSFAVSVKLYVIKSKLDIHLNSSSNKPNNRSMGWCKKDVTPLLTHWSYVFLALTHPDNGSLSERSRWYKRYFNNMCWVCEAQYHHSPVNTINDFVSDSEFPNFRYSWPCLAEAEDLELPIYMRESR